LTYRIGNLFNYVELPFTFVYPDWLQAIAVLVFAFAIMVQLHAPIYPFAVFCMIVSCYLGYFISKYAGLLLGFELVCWMIIHELTRYKGSIAWFHRCWIMW
jgi:hypothetical protein